mgnify:FL=1
MNKNIAILYSLIFATILIAAVLLPMVFSIGQYLESHDPLKIEIFIWLHIIMAYVIWIVFDLGFIGAIRMSLEAISISREEFQQAMPPAGTEMIISLPLAKNRTIVLPRYMRPLHWLMTCIESTRELERVVVMYKDQDGTPFVYTALIRIPASLTVEEENLTRWMLGAL